MRYLKNTSSIKFYLYKCLRHKIVRFLSGTKTKKFDENISSGFMSPVEEDIIRKEIVQEQIARLFKSFRKLTKRQRQVLYLKYYKDLDTQQMVDFLSISLKSAYNLVSKSKINLRLLLTDRNSMINLLPNLKTTEDE